MSKKILLIEDNAVDVFILSEMLKSVTESISIQHIEDGEGAMLFVNETLFQNPAELDIIFIDLNIPKVNGMDVLERIRSNKALDGIRIVVLSGSDYHKDIEHAKSLGANFYITKPISAKLLEQVLI